MASPSGGSQFRALGSENTAMLSAVENHMSLKNDSCHAVKLWSREKACQLVTKRSCSKISHHELGQINQVLNKGVLATIHHKLKVLHLELRISGTEGTSKLHEQDPRQPHGP